jgi:type IV pilus assembly protein PilB
MPDKGKQTLEQGLLDKGLITEEQLKEAVDEYEKTGKFIGEILVDKNFIEEADLVKHISLQYNIPKIDLSRFIIDEDIVKLVPEEICRENILIPLFKIDNTITISMFNPLNIVSIDKIQNETGCIVDEVISKKSDILTAVEQYYKFSNVITDAIKDVETGLGAGNDKIGIKGLEEIEDAPVVRAVNLIISQAIKDRASDIHIEPDKNMLRIRYRVDGVLKETLQLSLHLQSAVVSRIKVLAGMNIAEKRLPQDGHIGFKFEDGIVDLRVSTFPVILGEKVVLRILPQKGGVYSLEGLGLAEDMLRQFDSLIKQPYGIILATGPTGSGKTNTLYAALQKINAVEKNIITIEDPVEYQLEMLNQSQINPKAGWTFASGLRSILRQDPDIIMVGEIRDLDTADISIQSALTGHLVFSTLHTNDAPSTATRLIDMGVEPFLVSACLIGALAQRLVRLICPSCKEETKPKPELLVSLGLDEKDVTFYKSKGCKNCNKTGYKGRTGIFELMIPNDKIKALIMEKAPTNIIKKAAVESGMKTLKDSAVELLLQGKTTIDEVVRVIQDDVT